MLIELTSSQLMALKSIVAEYLLDPKRVEAFIDCSQDPPVETRPEDLFIALMTQDPV